MNKEQFNARVEGEKNRQQLQQQLHNYMLAKYLFDKKYYWVTKLRPLESKLTGDLARQLGPRLRRRLDGIEPNRESIVLDGKKKDQIRPSSIANKRNRAEAFTGKRNYVKPKDNSNKAARSKKTVEDSEWQDLDEEEECSAGADQLYQPRVFCWQAGGTLKTPSRFKSKLYGNYGTFFESAFQELKEKTEMDEKQEALTRSLYLLKPTGFSAQVLDSMPDKYFTDLKNSKPMFAVDKTHPGTTRLENLLQLGKPLNKLMKSSLRPTMRKLINETTLKKISKNTRNMLYCKKSAEGHESKPKCDKVTAITTVVAYHGRNAATAKAFQSNLGLLATPYKEATRFLLAGWNTLEDLCSCITCPDYFVGLRPLKHPRDQNSKKAFDNHSQITAFKAVIIEETIYESEHVHQNVVDWRGRRGIGPSPFKRGSLNGTLIHKLKVRFGFPYVFMHGNGCEHIFVFANQEAVTFPSTINMPFLSQSYPKLVYAAGYSKRLCVFHCGEYAEYIITACKAFPGKLYICQKCLLQRFFQAAGPSVIPMKVFPYEGVANSIW